MDSIISFDERPDGSVWRTITPKPVIRKDTIDDDDDLEQAITAPELITPAVDKPVNLSESTRDRLIAILG